MRNRRSGDSAGTLLVASSADAFPRSGLAIFQRNLASLQPVLRAALRTREIELLSARLSDDPSEAVAGADEDAGRCVEAAWRMGADLALPWRPRIELTGALQAASASASLRR